MNFSQFTQVQAKINVTQRGLNSTWSTCATYENLAVLEKKTLEICQDTPGYLRSALDH
jgi:hypothetical protein